MFNSIFLLIVTVFQLYRTVLGAQVNSFSSLHVDHRQPVIVLLHEWPLDSVARECELFLKSNGFSAIQITVTLERMETSHRAWNGKGRALALKIVDKLVNNLRKITKIQ